MRLVISPSSYTSIATTITHWSWLSLHGFSTLSQGRSFFTATSCEIQLTSLNDGAKRTASISRPLTNMAATWFSCITITALLLAPVAINSRSVPHLSLFPWQHSSRRHHIVEFACSSVAMRSISMVQWRHSVHLYSSIRYLDASFLFFHRSTRFRWVAEYQERERERGGREEEELACATIDDRRMKASDL